jgi:taurine dioxygenase
VSPGCVARRRATPKEDAMFDVARLPGPFGVEIGGLDLRGGADDKTMARLVDLLYEHRFLAIRGQALSKDEFLRFGRGWGRPYPHVLDHKRMPGYPEMMELGNTKPRAPNDKPAVFWHTDQAYEAEPASATMLYSVMAPEQGGETKLADMVVAYDALDAATKAEIANLKAMHFYGAASGRDGENVASVMINDAQRKAAPPVAHDLVRAHPVTGRKALYAVAGTPFQVVGMGETEGQALLSRLKAHATESRFVYFHKYRVGDLAIWDTLSTLHSATPLAPATGPSDSRLLWRISCKGLPKVVEARGVPMQTRPRRAG